MVLKGFLTMLKTIVLKNFSKKCFKKFGGLKNLLYLCTTFRAEKAKAEF